MIAKKQAVKRQNDNYRDLAEYIADADHQGEKVLTCWCMGCSAGDDYDKGIAEIEDVQALNTRTRKEKTYHLIIGFHPEDEAKLTPEIFQEMELEFAKVLGFEEHQRHCGVHKNTGNLHLHIAYNMIHPEKLTRREPFRDYNKLSEICRELEQRYGLFVVEGRESKDKSAKRISQKASAMEAHSGQQSFQSYAEEHKDAILEALEPVDTWRQAHEVFARYGLEIKTRGAGLVIKDKFGKS